MKKTIISFILIIFQTIVYAQLNPSGSIYYLNPYLVNPAFAGIQTGWEANISYKAQWTAIPNAPSMQSFTTTFGTEAKIGLGLNVSREDFGVFNRTDAKLTYAYHLPLDEDDAYFDFGISGGVKNNRIDYRKVVAEAGDQTLLNFQKPWTADGDVGVLIRKSELTFAATINDLRKLLRNQYEFYADQPGIMLSIRSQIEIQGIIFTPLIQYQHVRYYRNVWDVGVQGGFAKGKLNASMVYHSTNSITFSIGTDYMERLKLVAFYTSGTSDLRQYSNGEFEFAMQLRW